MSFQIHPLLQQDCIELGHFQLCRLLLMNDSNFPWFILVPERLDISEIHQLSDEDQVQLIRECSHLSRELAQSYRADKMNVAALGNMVPQLHIHHIVRYKTDPAWAGPVWGKVKAVPYGPDALAAVKTRIFNLLGTPGKLAYTSEG